MRWTCGCTLCPYVRKSVQSRAILASGSVTNEQMRPAIASCSKRLYRPWLQCSKTGSLVWAQETVYTSTSALRRQTVRHKRQCRWRCRSLSRGAQLLTHNWAIRCFVWPNVISQYLTSRNLILEREKKLWDSSRSRLVNIPTGIKTNCSACDCV